MMNGDISNVSLPAIALDFNICLETRRSFFGLGKRKKYVDPKAAHILQSLTKEYRIFLLSPYHLPDDIRKLFDPYFRVEEYINLDTIARARDFMIYSPVVHTVSNILNLYGLNSPTISTWDNKDHAFRTLISFGPL